MLRKPLAGLTVVALEQAISLPLCTRHLADSGARVIKIERLGEGDYTRTIDRRTKGLSSHFVWSNRGKESIALDIKKPEGIQIVHELISKADVFAQNLVPGALPRLGIDIPQLRQQYPKLVICSVSGYGTGGPYAHKKAYDLLLQVESGLVSITGTEDTPAKVGIPISDISSSMYAYSGVLTALYVRATTGRGNAFEVSMLDAIGDFMGYAYSYKMYSDESGQIPRKGAFHATITPYGPYRTGDGNTVVFAVQSTREWKVFCEQILQRRELVDDVRFKDATSRVQNRDALKEIIESVFSKSTAEEVIDRLERASIANAKMRDLQSSIDHPQREFLQRWGSVDSPVGPLKMLKPVVRLEGETGEMDRIPALGENTEAVLRDTLGYSPERIQQLKSKQVIQ